MNFNLLCHRKKRFGKKSVKNKGCVSRKLKSATIVNRIG
jgi:hypothetical protein